MAPRLRGEGGSASGSWLVQALVVLAVLGLLGYEAASIGLTSLSVDDGSRQVARAARDAYRAAGGSIDAAADEAAEAARIHGAMVTDVAVDVDEEVLTVTLERRAPTVVIHRVGPLADLGRREATGRANLAAR